MTSIIMHMNPGVPIMKSYDLVNWEIVNYVNDTYASGEWNHNPDPTNWPLAQLPGYMRLTTSKVSFCILKAQNKLTQRTFGPKSTGINALETNGMKEGDYAGLAAFQAKYGFVGVKMSGNSKSIVMVNASFGSMTEVQCAGQPEQSLSEGCL